MNILWFVHSVDPIDGSLSSHIASVRLRCLVPAKVMKDNYGWNVSIINLKNKVIFEGDILHRADIAVFGKVFFDVGSLCDFLRKHEIPIVADICDDVFSLPHLKSNYKSLIRHADNVVVSCKSLSERFVDKTNEQCSVIDDAIEGPRKFVGSKIDKGGVINLVWFGQPANIDPLKIAVKQIVQECKYKFKLSIVTRPDDFIKEWFDMMVAEYGMQIDLRLHEWSLIEQCNQIELSDIVLIPSDQNISKQVKTVNRLAASLWLGKPVVAYPIPSYIDMENYAFLNESMADGINKILQLPANELGDKVFAGQAYIEENFSPETIANKWRELLEDTVENYIEPEVSDVLGAGKQEELMVKLNLGCGDKILPDYINVDLVEERAGNQPDVFCDIRNLDIFDDNYADEVLTVHVIEHFYYWEAAEVLKEWVRVLKPGGKMIIECPNLLSACEEVLKNPEQSTKPGQEGQRTMWVFYGDPAWKDPLMCHKWLYTPQSLGRLMSDCGLVQIRQEAAQFKLREPRDMRIVGTKVSK